MLKGLRDNADVEENIFLSDATKEKKVSPDKMKDDFFLLAIKQCH